MEQPEIFEEASLNIFEEASAIKGPDHFVLASGEHSEYYIDKWAVFHDTVRTSALCAMLANKIFDRFTGKGSGADIQIICGPADGGNIVARDTATNLWHMQKWNNILPLHTKRESDGFRFMRGYEKMISEKEVVLAEDMLSTGSSVMKLAKTVSGLGGKIICLSALWNRGTVKPEDVGGIEIISLINKEIRAWPATPEHPCYLCQIGRPINTRFGYGKEFVEKRMRCM